MSEQTPRLVKRPTGVPGLDQMTRGGLPAGSATLVLGQPGAGKTVLCLQILAAAAGRDEGGVYISFEESREQIERGGESFDWGAALIESGRWRVVDARPRAGIETSGQFDLQGLQAALSFQAEQVAASWVVLDGIDRLLRLNSEPHAAVEQILELNAWCSARGISLLITGKRIAHDSPQPAYLEGIEFMLDTVLLLSTQLVSRRLNRRFQIAKYRGSGHATDEVPMLLSDGGIELPFSAPATWVAQADSRRVGTGIPRLDKLLGGGVYRGSATLISGEPGTAKTTLACSITAAAAARGERVLYVSFDELADRIVRNVAGVGIDLAGHRDSGRLVISTREAWRSLLEEHYIAMERLITELQPAFLVIDPISALLKSATAAAAKVTIERMLGNARAQGITIVITSLNEYLSQTGEATLSHASTLADNWIVLDYQVRAGERNRSLSIVKSRGSAHSNQVRELILSADGVALADVYQFGSEVLMGTARMQKEGEEAAVRRRQLEERERRRHDLEYRIEKARERLREAHEETRRLERELELEQRDAEAVDEASMRHRREVLRRRDHGSGPEDDGADTLSKPLGGGEGS